MLGMLGTIADAEERLARWRQKARWIMADISADSQSSFKVDVVADALADAYRAGQSGKGKCPCCGRRPTPE